MENSFPEILKINDVHHCGQNKKFIFQEIPEQYYDEITNKLIYKYWFEETIYSGFNLLNDAVSELNFKNDFKKYLSQKMSIGIFEYRENDKNKLVGLNVLFPENIDSLKIINSNLSYYEQITNHIKTVKKRYVEQLVGNEYYLASKMLFVLKDYRKHGLALQLLELRNYVGKKYNLKYTISVFTSSTSQKLAENVGFERKYIHNFNDALDNKKNYLFPLLKDKIVMCMIKYYI